MRCGASQRLINSPPDSLVHSKKQIKPPNEVWRLTECSSDLKNNTKITRPHFKPHEGIFSTGGQQNTGNIGLKSVEGLHGNHLYLFTGLVGRVMRRSLLAVTPSPSTYTPVNDHDRKCEQNRRCNIGPKLFVKPSAFMSPVLPYCTASR
ncbi:hypothetical protein O181_065775 [Austropuccinia psidii MF-1]|uniref:Uncharacterized protein n=1 Tax=Austropuccinia psidii MF-1 TaxID=1389203 RepID=A0A9Q3I4F4_9BASI|nr:hypothetical protein [Austropuccinia psidii MF-1]